LTRIPISVLALCGVLLVARPASADDQVQQASAHYKQGRTHFDNGRYDQAIAEFRAAYELAPRPLLLYHLARSYQGKGDKVKALSHYQRFLTEDTKNAKVGADARAQVAALQKAIEAEEKAKAEAEAKRVATAGAEAEREARRLASAGDHDGAAAKYEAAYDLRRDADLLFAAAEERRAAGGAERAVEAYRRYLEAAPAGKSRQLAEERIRALTVEKQVVDATPPPFVPPPSPTAEPGAPKKRWLWIGGGVAAIGAGLAIDLIPASAKNEELDLLDFVPLVFYAAGAAGITYGVF